MAKNSIEAYGAQGKSNVLMFDPDDLTVVTDPTHPLFDERALNPPDPAMMASIDAQGVFVTIIVNKNGETGDVEVVDGRQRVINARATNAKRRLEGRPIIKVPGTIQKDGRRDGGKRLAAVGFAANQLRRQDPPLILAGKMARGVDMGMSDHELAVAFGCDVATVRSTMALLEAPRAVQEAVNASQITLTQAKALSKLPPVVQREKVQELVAAGEGVKPHERARRQAKVMGNAPRIKSRKEIMQRLEGANGHYRDALMWVLGIEPAVDQASLAAAVQAMSDFGSQLAGKGPTA
jgi:ParB family chromosome partitioning protein